jgi:adenine-specific DNA-methyltransferase
LLQEGTFDAPQLGFRIFRARPTNLVVEPPIVATEGMTGDQYVQTSLVRAESEPVVKGAESFAVAWEVVLKASGTQLDATVTEHDIDGVGVYEFTPAENQDSDGRLFVSLDAFSLATADKLKLTDADTLILRGDKVDDATTLTLAPRLPSKLILLERVPREVSL